MKTESVYPEHWEKRTRDEVLVLIDEYIRWYNHERIKQSLGWMSPVQYRQSQGMAVVPEVLRKSGLARCRVGFSRLSAWCHRVGTCPGSGGPSSRR